MVREFAEFRLGAFKTAAQFQVAAVFLRQEIGYWPFDHLVAMIFQLHVADDLGLQQADGIAGDGIAETGVKFLRHRSAAHHVAPFHDAHFQARLGKIEGADKAIMAGADDHGIILFGHARLHPAGG